MICWRCKEKITKEFDLINVGGKTVAVHKHCEDSLEEALEDPTGVLPD